MRDAIHLLIGIAVPYLVAGLVDVAFKERIKRRILASGGRFSDLPSWLLHARGWHLYFTGVWIAFMLVEVLFLHWPWQITLGVVVFYTEDVVYYAFTWLLFGGTYGEGRFFPRQLIGCTGISAGGCAVSSTEFPVRACTAIHPLRGTAGDLLVKQRRDRQPYGSHGRMFTKIRTL